MENNNLKEQVRKDVKEKIAVSNIRKEFDMKSKNNKKLIIQKGEFFLKERKDDYEKDEKSSRNVNGGNSSNGNAYVSDGSKYSL